MGIFCKHKWVEQERHMIDRKYMSGGKTTRLLIIQRCEKCGKLKKRSFP